MKIVEICLKKQGPGSFPTKLHITYFEWNLDRKTKNLIEGKNASWVGVRIPIPKSGFKWIHMYQLLNSHRPFSPFISQTWKARPSLSRKDTGRARLRRNTRYRILSQTALPDRPLFQQQLIANHSPPPPPLRQETNSAGRLPSYNWLLPMFWFPYNPFRRDQSNR